MEIEFQLIQRFISESGYKINGASPEKAFADYLSNEFPNSEKYWRQFIVPITNRIVDYTSNNDLPNVRDGVAQELRDIGSYHYSIFINLIYATLTIEGKKFSFFEQFYFHLGLVCDLVEEFLQKVYLLMLVCIAEKSKILQQTSKEEFLQKAEEWYDKYYSTLFEHYYSKGKSNPIRLPPRKYILDEYFKEFQSWKTYKQIAEEIKNYRNVVTHHHALAFPNDENGNLYLPRKKFLNDYKQWNAVEKMLNSSTINSHFILRDVLMKEHLEKLKTALQHLWEKPILDMNELLYVQRNKNLLLKYNLTFK